MGKGLLEIFPLLNRVITVDSAPPWSVGLSGRGAATAGGGKGGNGGMGTGQVFSIIYVF